MPVSKVCMECGWEELRYADLARAVDRPNCRKCGGRLVGALDRPADLELVPEALVWNTPIMYPIKPVR
jgi:hypothetical protein